MSSNYIEVIPSLPTYFINEDEVTKVLKFLFCPENMTCEKIVYDSPVISCQIEDYENNELMVFSTPPFATDLMPAESVVHLYVNSDFDVEHTEQALAFWGIKRASMDILTAKTVSIRNLLAAFSQAFAEGTPDNVEVQCDNGEIVKETNLFSDYHQDRLLEEYERVKRTSRGDYNGRL